MNRKNILNNLGKLISFQSVSTDKKRFKEILKTVDFITNYLKKLGFKINLYQKKDYPPLIIAEKIVNKNEKIIGFYAHYDVQPEDPINQWKTEPFKLTLKNGKLFGRGVADDKGHLWQIISAAEYLIKNDRLKNNLVFVFEGEEEIGSLNFEELVKKSKQLKKVDVFYVVDMGMKNRKNPEIFYGLRGIVDYELKIKTHKTDLHSGVYGNIVLNPAQILAELMVKMVDGQTHKVKIPRFYRDVKKISKQEKQLLEKSTQGSIAAKILPSLDINGIYSGYINEGIKTIIPAEATVKFSIRIVPDQNWKTIDQLVKKFIKENLPKEVNYTLTSFAGSNPFYTDFKNDFVKITADRLKKVFGGEVFYNRSGGSVPAAEILQRLFKKPVILIGFILPDCQLHAPNENYDEKNFWKGFDALIDIMK